MSADNSFGRYLKGLRQKIDMTQESLGEKVGRNKMTISLIEAGKNNPPDTELLEKISVALSLDPDNRAKLFDLAAIARGAIPIDLRVYFADNQEISAAIRRAKDKGITNEQWKIMI